MIDELLERAQAGDESAFRALTEPHRRELHAHCYRIVGSVQDAEDLVQETLLAAWRGLDRFEHRASPRTWLYRIATNRCLNALRDEARRPTPLSAPAPAAPALPEPTRFDEPVWLQPYPDSLLEGLPDAAPGPEARYEARESMELAFVRALQHLPPRGRAALVLRDVLGYRTAEVAAMLDTSETSVKGLLQRARTTVATLAPAGERAQPPAPDSARERALAGRFADAIEHGDMRALVALLTADAWVTMPPAPHQYQGHAAIFTFLTELLRRRGANFQLVPTRANTQPAFGCYLPTPPARIARAYGMIVLDLDGDLISTVTFFRDAGVFPHFGLPRTLPTPDRP
jgi:RNA polymerase sigma-70 factor (TIGR02960 family)